MSITLIPILEKSCFFVYNEQVSDTKNNIKITVDEHIYITTFQEIILYKSENTAEDILGPALKKWFQQLHKKDAFLLDVSLDQDTLPNASATLLVRVHLNPLISIPVKSQPQWRNVVDENFTFSSDIDDEEFSIHSLEDIYSLMHNSLFSTKPLAKTGIVSTLDSVLRTPLHNHQKASLEWMFRREREEKNINSKSFLWLSVISSQGEVYYLNRGQCLIRQQPPITYPLYTRGGVLADEMGLGKSLQILSLVGIDKLQSGLSQTPRPSLWDQQQKEVINHCYKMRVQEQEKRRSSQMGLKRARGSGVLALENAVELAKERSKGRRSLSLSSSVVRLPHDSLVTCLCHGEITFCIFVVTCTRCKKQFHQWCVSVQSSFDLCMLCISGQLREILFLSLPQSRTQEEEEFITSRTIPTTLLCCPANIAHQWIAEASKHFQKNFLSIYHYPGIKHLLQNIQNEPLPFYCKRHFEQYDIVVISFDTLSDELSYSHFNEGIGVKKTNIVSPLTTVVWSRFVMDESQMSGGLGRLFLMSCEIFAHVRWLVTGTPIAYQSFSADFTTILFLMGLSLSSVLEQCGDVSTLENTKARAINNSDERIKIIRNATRTLKSHFYALDFSYLLEQRGHGFLLLRRVFDSIGDFFRRNRVDMVSDIFPSKEHVDTEIKFLPIEKYFYREEVRKGKEYLLQHSSKIDEFPLKVIQRIRLLRWATVHPQLVGGLIIDAHGQKRRRKKQKKTGIMPLLENLIGKTQQNTGTNRLPSYFSLHEVHQKLIEELLAQMKEHFRATLCALNGLAGVNFAFGKIEEAKALYREVLRESFHVKVHFEPDRIQLIHAAWNLADALARGLTPMKLEEGLFELENDRNASVQPFAENILKREEQNDLQPKVIEEEISGAGKGEKVVSGEDDMVPVAKEWGDMNGQGVEALRQYANQMIGRNKEKFILPLLKNEERLLELHRKIEVDVADGGVYDSFREWFIQISKEYRGEINEPHSLLSHRVRTRLEDSTSKKSVSQFLTEAMDYFSAIDRIRQQLLHQDLKLFLKAIKNPSEDMVLDNTVCSICRRTEESEVVCFICTWSKKFDEYSVLIDATPVSFVSSQQIPSQNLADDEDVYSHRVLYTHQKNIRVLKFSLEAIRSVLLRQKHSVAADSSLQPFKQDNLSLSNEINEQALAEEHEEGLEQATERETDVLRRLLDLFELYEREVDSLRSVIADTVNLFSVLDELRICRARFYKRENAVEPVLSKKRKKKNDESTLLKSSLELSMIEESSKADLETARHQFDVAKNKYAYLKSLLPESDTKEVATTNTVPTSEVALLEDGTAPTLGNGHLGEATFKQFSKEEAHTSPLLQEEHRMKLPDLKVDGTVSRSSVEIPKKTQKQIEWSCPICWSGTAAVRTYFECGHSFCMDCIRRMENLMKKKDRGKERRIITCPTCRSSQEIDKLMHAHTIPTQDEDIQMEMTTELVKHAGERIEEGADREEIEIGEREGKGIRSVYGSKVCALIRLLASILDENLQTKILVMTDTVDTFDFLIQVFREFQVPFNFLVEGAKRKNLETVSDFMETSYTDLSPSATFAYTSPTPPPNFRGVCNVTLHQERLRNIDLPCPSMSEIRERLRLDHRQTGSTFMQYEEKEDYQSERIYFPVLLTNKTTCGRGLTLTRANHLIFPEVFLSHPDEAQAIGRIYRLGQRNKCYIWRVYHAGTIEGKLLSNMDTEGAPLEEEEGEVDFKIKKELETKDHVVYKLSIDDFYSAFE